jgi:hypothetical protein
MDNGRGEKMERELLEIVNRTGPVMGEYFDGFAVLGVRAGTELGAGMHVIVSDSDEQQIAVENLLLTVAAAIIERRANAAHEEY